MKNLTVLLSVIIFVVLISCHLDPGLEPTRSGIRGTIYFLNEWPEDTDQVLVVAATTFPPTGLADIVLGEPLPTFVDSTDYVLYTAPGTFAAVGVVWKEKGQPWDVTNIIGIYFPTEDHFTPGIVEVKNRNHMADSIDIVADLSKAKRKVDSTIEGMIRVVGEWPAGATSVLVAASNSLIPQGLLDIQFGMPIPAGFDSTTYVLSVQPGTYRLVGTLVLEQDVPIGIQSVRGVYYRKPGDFLPGIVKVPSDTSHIKGIDITIDFNKSPFPLLTGN